MIGIDPGPTGFAWAEFDGEKFVRWGECDSYLALREMTPTHVAIEQFIPYQRVDMGSEATIRTVGRLEAVCQLEGFPYVLIPRIKVAASCGKPTFLKRGQRFGDSQIIKYLGVIYPETLALRPIKQYNHILAACAVAHCAVGVFQARNLANYANL